MQPPTKEILRVLGAFFAFVFVGFGIFLLIGTRVISLPDNIKTTYFLEIPDRALLLSLAMISVGLTYFWVQRRKLILTKIIVLMGVIQRRS